MKLIRKNIRKMVVVFVTLCTFVTLGFGSDAREEERVEDPGRC
jgi:hypothetical protein